MKKQMYLKSVLTLVLMFVTMGEVSAQGFLGKLLKSVDLEGVVNTIKWEDVPTYTAQKFYETDDAGNQLTNADGTPVYRVFLVDQNGNKRSKEAVEAQSKQINNALLRITAKVGTSALIGYLTGKSDAAAIGALTGGLLSVGDIITAYRLKASQKKQKKLLEQYQTAFTDEGTPVDAAVDLSKLSGLGLKDDNVLSLTSSDIKKELESDTYSQTTVKALDDFDFSKL